MELQGKKVTHDFLSLYSSDSSFQLQDPRPASQGFFLKTRDFLQPLEREEKCEARGAEAAVADAAAAVPAERPAEHVLPGGVGTYTIGHAADAGARAAASNPGRSAAWGFPIGLETKPEPDYGSRSTTTSYGSYAAAGGGASYTLWDDKDTASRGQWPSHFATPRGSGNNGAISATAAPAPGRHNLAPEKKRFIEAATSRSSRGYDGLDDEDEEEFGKREGSSSRKDLSIKVDGKASCTDQRPNTPRSKHSATEQRRRSKINDRFQILRELIPHSDQKRDKASFLLEVIEYIRFLQEKVQKYESSHLGWNQDNAKLMPWSNGQAPANGLFVPSLDLKNDSAPHAQVFSKKFDDSSIPVIPSTPLNFHNPPAKGVTAGISFKTMETTTSFASNPAATHSSLQPRLFPVGKETSFSQSQQRMPDADNVASHDQSPWLRPFSLADCAMSRRMLNEREELKIDEGTISVSAAYSHGLLNTLTQALQKSGVDLSQANISVQINLGKRAINRRPNATATISIVKDLADPATSNQVIGYRRVGAGGEESSQASKRLKVHS